MRVLKRQSSLPLAPARLQNPLATAAKGFTRRGKHCEVTRCVCSVSPRSPLSLRVVSRSVAKSAVLVYLLSAIMVRKKYIEGNWKEGTWSLSEVARSSVRGLFVFSATQVRSFRGNRRGAVCSFSRVKFVSYKVLIYLFVCRMWVLPITTICSWFLTLHFLLTARRLISPAEDFWAEELEQPWATLASLVPVRIQLSFLCLSIELFC